MSTIKHPTQRRRSTYAWYPPVEAGSVITAIVAAIMIPPAAMTPLAIAMIVGVLALAAGVRMVASYADALEGKQ